MVRPIEHRGLLKDDGGDIFTDVGEFRATLYHSLCADVGQDTVPEAEWRRGVGKWKTTTSSEKSELVPLAWVEEPCDSSNNSSGENGPERVLMAVRHRTRPFWGLQYHPESVCTELEGAKVVANWFREAIAWNEACGRIIDRRSDILARRSRRASLLSQILPPVPAAVTEQHQKKQPSWRSHALGFRHSTDSIPLPVGVSVVDIVEGLGQAAGGEQQIVLDSATASSSGGAPDIRGRYSIVALDVPEALRLEHHVGDRHLTAILPPAAGAVPSSSARSREEVPLGDHRSIWHFLAAFHEARRLPRGGEDGGQVRSPSPAGDLPFMGGFMGFVTYEQGLSDINVAFPTDRGHHRPDVCLSWVTRSVVIDHAKRVLHIQHLHDPATKGQAWVDSVIKTLRASPRWRHPSGGGDTTDESHQQQPRMRRGSKPDPASRVLFGVSSITKPGAEAYEAKVETCQDYIAAGESYELCLTDQTVVRRRRVSGSWPDTTATAVGDNVTVAVRAQKKRRRSSLTCSSTIITASSPPSSSWQLFRALRSRQPVPFASYLRLGGATLVSSSPERFLQYDERGLCSMRPMKGTVRKSAATAPTLADAERILHVPKEEAENLMIVDLVRHDLHGICGAGNVAARDLMRVEEYRSVFQMTTVVEGQLPSPDGQGKERERYTGLDVLAASLPPGSMTGAPKKRSCEILHEIEGRVERSLYSGVVGYMCVSGRGDWSVTIRSMFRWDDDDDAGEEIWRIGAGGAVTILSTPQGEREEMFVKLAGPLGIFACQE
ncbi:aminodeoxychorismate synthase [Magnaporthiopsis poae ATCC 64411]|uniref:Aminodeoxychorismate synthase n=1 Tax=Magnaporthiopsis poae (strain ATCC 64411 / 73-15) TaxID=644358 RepID=A0A0C4EGH4_MAGP6|nr:aminodeoxychorismate synthase [Magnaporthiopsis poae ATCC 64411]